MDNCRSPHGFRGPHAPLIPSSQSSSLGIARYWPAYDDCQQTADSPADHQSYKDVPLSGCDIDRPCPVQLHFNNLSSVWSGSACPSDISNENDEYKEADSESDAAYFNDNTESHRFASVYAAAPGCSLGWISNSVISSKSSTLKLSLGPWTITVRPDSDREIKSGC